ncbi:MAG: hypothetical protein EOR01_33125 [Mesorhizobium sp.]|nr:MAG: hypothetical protein EOR01_33125 [Mesorhizobium sp.]
MSPQQLFAWRRKAIRSGAIAVLPYRSEAGTQSFASVEVLRADGPRAGGVEIIIGDETIRVGNDVAATLLIEAIRAVRAE